MSVSTGLITAATRQPGSGAYLTRSMDDVLLGGQLLKTHGTPRVQFLSADTYLRAEAELIAVDEPGRGIDEDCGGVDLACEAVACRAVIGDDRLTVA